MEGLEWRPGRWVRSAGAGPPRAHLAEPHLLRHVVELLGHLVGRVRADAPHHDGVQGRSAAARRGVPASLGPRSAPCTPRPRQSGVPARAGVARRTSARPQWRSVAHPDRVESPIRCRCSSRHLTYELRRQQHKCTRQPSLPDPRPQSIPDTSRDRPELAGSRRPRKRLKPGTRQITGARSTRSEGDQDQLG